MSYEQQRKITEEDIKPIIDKADPLLYKTGISIFNKYYSGLILLKQTDSVTSHLVFVTELGMKMFDYQIQHGVFSLAYVFEPLNKPKFLNLLESDLKLIFLQEIFSAECKVYKGKDGYAFMQKNSAKRTIYITNNASQIRSITIKGRLFKKEKINYTYVDNKAQQIRLKHKGFIPLKMKLNNISTR